MIACNLLAHSPIVYEKEEPWEWECWLTMTVRREETEKKARRSEGWAHGRVLLAADCSSRAKFGKRFTDFFCSQQKRHNHDPEAARC